MLRVRNVSKIYQTDEVELRALDDVSVDLRRSEFVSILGPSGSGKTTLLNIIGGLDHYTSGDLVIDGVSTKDYTDADWDTYRNHRVGFVFQSYNLIMHQTVLQNVELALTLSGVSGAEKKRRAKAALEEVGLGKHLNKRPGQLSGGQMQRVAIARALVNDPDIILADEPTGALDSKTSVQIMEILKKIAKNKLVVMVTHNPELAKQYSTRIITVKDGKIIGDTDPFDGKGEGKTEDRKRHTSMGLGTALSLSFNNLLTKRGRTLLTAFAGSIGIIGIALILALANGVNSMATDAIKGGSLPSDISVSETYDGDGGTMATTGQNVKQEETAHDGTVVAKDDMSEASYVLRQSNVKHNDTAALKKYIEEHKGELEGTIETIKYDYGMPMQIYDKNANGEIVKINPIVRTTVSSGIDLLSAASVVEDVTTETIITSPMREIVSNVQYDLVSGSLPTGAGELLLVVNDKNELPLTTMYALNIEDRTKLDEIIKKLNNGEKPEFVDISYKFDDIIGKTYRVLPADETGEVTAEEYTGAQELKVVGVAKAKNENDASGYMGYTHALVEEMTPASAKEKPAAISFYAKANDGKEKIKAFLDKYNNSVAEGEKVHYEDRAESIAATIRQIVDMLSYVLVGFVAISLVVSSIMIGIITYISVLERTKEIGILRAIGASKRDVKRVFRAETIIEGLVAGVLGVAMSWMLCMAINTAVSAMAHVDNVARLSLIACGALIAVSVALTVVAGALPARRASKKDPVESLRSE